MSWPKVPLGHLFTISSSKRVLESQWREEGVPFYRAREIVSLARDGQVKNKLFIDPELYSELQKYGVPQAGDLMVSAVGTLGACYLVKPGDKFYYKDASVIRLSPKERLHSEFFKMAFEHGDVLNQIASSAGSTVGTLTISRASEIQVALPPIEQQIRIAAILDQADTIRRARDKTIALLQEADRSIFGRTFGDIRTNSAGWPLIELGSICRPRQWKTISMAELTESGYPVYGANGQVGYYSSFNHENPTVLVTCRGATCGAINVCAPQSYVTGNAMALDDLDERVTSVEFLAELLRHVDMRKVISGSAQPQIIRATLSKLRVPMPPTTLQESYLAKAAAIEEQRSKVRRQNLSALFASLQHRAFRGEL